MPVPSRRRPNFMVIGTPGTGKTSLAKKVASLTGLNYMNLGDIAKEVGAISGYDSQRNCQIIDDELLLNHIESVVLNGGNIIEYHGCDMFTDRTIDRIFLLRCSPQILYSRLKRRGYDEDKTLENLRCEVMDIVGLEARENFALNIISTHTNDLPTDTDAIVETIQREYEAYIRCH